MTEAMELRVDPTDQCNWEQMLKPGVEGGCGPGTTSRKVFSENFEDGLKGWTQTNQSVFGGPTFAWKAAASAEVPMEEPAGDGHTSKVAFGPTPDEGDCSGTATDISGANYLTSPRIRIPSGALSPRLSFDHYLATELGFDGGTVQIPVSYTHLTLPTNREV